MGIEYQHRQAVHCESGVTSALLRFQGIEMNEQMVFGIGSGLFFGYFPFIKIGSIMVITFRNAPGGIFRKTVRRLGVPHEVRRYRDPQKAHAGARPTARSAHMRVSSNGRQSGTSNPASSAH